MLLPLIEALLLSLSDSHWGGWTQNNIVLSMLETPSEWVDLLKSRVNSRVSYEYINRDTRLPSTPSLSFAYDGKLFSILTCSSKDFITFCLDVSLRHWFGLVFLSHHIKFYVSSVIREWDTLAFCKNFQWKIRFFLISGKLRQFPLSRESELGMLLRLYVVLCGSIDIRQY